MISLQVWMISASYYPHVGGGETQLQRLAEHLMQRGWKVSVVTRRHNRRYSYLPSSFEVINGVPVHRVPAPGQGPLGSVFFLITALFFLARNGRKSLYHAHGVGAPALIAILARLLLRGRAVVKLRSGPRIYRKLRNTPMRKLALQLQLRFVDQLIVVNRELIESLCRWGVPHNRIFFFPNAIDAVNFTPATPQAFVSARRKWHLCGKSVFIYVGRLVSLKGVDTLLSAWARLPQEQRAGAMLLIVGDGPQQSNLVAQADTLQVSESVRFLGLQSNILEMLSASDVFVLPSGTEGLSNAMLEAMACGLPIVCTAVGGALDWIHHDVNGYLAPPEDVTGLHNALSLMLDNRTAWREMGKHSRSIVESELSFQATTGKIERLYTRLFEQINVAGSPKKQ